MDSEDRSDNIEPAEFAVVLVCLCAFVFALFKLLEWLFTIMRKW